MLPITRVLTLSRFYTSCLSSSPWIGFSRIWPSTLWTICSSRSTRCKYFHRFKVLFYVFLGIESIIWLILVHCYLSFLRVCGLNYVISLMLNCLLFEFLRVCGFKVMSHYEAAIFTARRLEMCEIVEMTLFYFLDRPQVHSPLSGLPFMVSGYNSCAYFLCMSGLICAVSYFCAVCPLIVVDVSNESLEESLS